VETGQTNPAVPSRPNRPLHLYIHPLTKHSQRGPRRSCPHSGRTQNHSPFLTTHLERTLREPYFLLSHFTQLVSYICSLLTFGILLYCSYSHDIYKWHSDQRRQAAARVRSASFAGPSNAPHPAFEHIHEPGGFRRNYVKLRANEQGTEEPEMLNNFIDFLFIFGHFVSILFPSPTPCCNHLTAFRTWRVLTALKKCDCGSEWRKTYIWDGIDTFCSIFDRRVKTLRKTMMKTKMMRRLVLG